MAAVGLNLFVENGFDKTTMDDIAAAAGISRPTLFRYFPTKASIVWHGSERDAQWLRETLASAPSDRAPLDILCDVMPHLIHSDAAELPLLRTQVLLISSVPTVQVQTDVRMAEFTDIVAAFIASRTDAAPTDLLPRVTTSAIWAASWTALACWAESTADVPTATLVEAFDGLRNGFRSQAPTAEG
ncbi:mycofactocin system transcriptional regulator [soil metagenome]